ncbi:hypothetical protein BDV12DRAFT_143990 [Aspergillus spectabilis]
MILEVIYYESNQQLDIIAGLSNKTRRCLVRFKVSRADDPQFLICDCCESGAAWELWMLAAQQPRDGNQTSTPIDGTETTPHGNPADNSQPLLLLLLLLLFPESLNPLQSRSVVWARESN